MERIPWPGAPADSRARATIGAQLGRDTRGEVAIVARCEYGLPAVVRTAPRLRDGTPFPTLYYLTCPMAVRAAGRLEASGAMRDYERRLAEDADVRGAYEDADERYRAQRDSLAVLPDAPSAGGMPGRVKCLHALYAHELADGNPIGALVRDAIEPLGCPGPCVTDGEPAPGHPGFAGKGHRNRHKPRKEGA
ncbi:MAG TPA: DUF501 domain-containing protein [Actinomycetota bacterium]